jgi:hypothetical protein
MLYDENPFLIVHKSFLLPCQAVVFAMSLLISLIFPASFAPRHLLSHKYINMAMSHDIAIMWNHLSDSNAFTTSTYR